MLKILCEKGTNFASRCWGLFLENLRVIGRFDKSRKFMTLSQNMDTTCIFKFSLRYLCSFTTDKDFPCSIKFLHGILKIVSAKI